MAKRKSRVDYYEKLQAPFTAIPHYTTQSPELNKLSTHARWLYVVLLTKFTRMNGKIKDYYPFTYEEIKEITGYDNRRISACLKQLDNAGFIIIDKGGKHIPSKYKPNLEWLTGEGHPYGNNINKSSKSVTKESNN